MFCSSQCEYRGILKLCHHGNTLKNEVTDRLHLKSLSCGQTDQNVKQNEVGAVALDWTIKRGFDSAINKFLMTYLEFYFFFFLLLFVLKTVISIKIPHKHLADCKPSKSQCNLNANMTVIKSNPSLPFNLIDNLITLLLCTTSLRCHIISNDTPVTESNSWPKVIRVPLKIVHGSYQCFHGWKVFELSVWCLCRSEFLCNVDSRIEQWESDAAWLHTKQSLVEFSCYLTLLFYKRSPYQCT